MQYLATIDWLLAGDPVVRWQVMRDLLSQPAAVYEHEQQRITREGWGRTLLNHQDEAGTWGQGLYNPKWISTTYTLELLRRLGLPAENPQARRGAQLLLESGFRADGGINFGRTVKTSETCITGLVLGILAHFHLDDPRLSSILEYVTSQQMPDGGWNCQYPATATHASMHTTLLVLEALTELRPFKPDWDAQIRQLQSRAHEFLLVHQLFRSHRTGKVIDPRMLYFSFPPHWRYNILMALDYFQKNQHPFDARLRPAIEILKKKARHGAWLRQSKAIGRVWFELEPVGKPARLNTLIALRILKWWQQITDAGETIGLTDS